ncbi:hypothetical protein [Chelativorans xinjiangense]|uniref:hypothetical protein n=1 Tax=Chelativorans xinjiangense TaxID=2681485 RepID=UPI0013580D61|nr:hypothetical protein [Chelativorans xinjiangense]
MTQHPSGLLIFGSSYVGKSTLAERLGRALAWRVVSSDSLARHPGRPWPEVRAPVAEYYSRLTDDTIYWFLRTHHENMWPLVGQKIDAERGAKGGFVLEGSALRPEYIVTVDCSDLLVVGLHADRDFLQERMRSESLYRHQDDRNKVIFDKFIERSLRDNAAVCDAANRYGLRLVNVAAVGAHDRLFEELCVVLGSSSSLP